MPPTSELTAALDRYTGASGARVWSAPGRINLIGEHIDYSGGVVLPFAIDRRTYAVVTPRADGQLTLRSLQRRESVDDPVIVAAAALDTEPVTGWAAFPAGVIWAIRKHYGSDLLHDGADVVIDGHVTPGSGLSSSAALACAVALAAADTTGLPIDARALAHVAHTAESEYVGVPCGLMDQMASMLCAERHVLAFDTAAQTTRQVLFEPHLSGAEIVLITTRTTRELGNGEYAKRRAAVEEAAAALGLRSLRDASGTDLERLADPTVRRRAEHVVAEIRRVDQAVHAIENADWPTLGQHMTDSHLSLRDLFEVSRPELDLAVSAVLAAGGLGARLTGGGFGGSVIALVDRSVMADTADNVRAAFRGAGYPPPTVRVVRPAPGAHAEM